MLKLVAPEAARWEKLDLDSHRKMNFEFPVGTFIKIWSQHDGHNYPSESFAIVANYYEKYAHVKTKTFMQALRADGTMGNNLFIYNPFNPHFEPWPILEDIKLWVEALPATLEARALLTKLEE